VLLSAVVFSLKTSCPKAVFCDPVVLSSNVCLPNALFLPPDVLFAKAEAPKALFSEPVVRSVNVSFPTAVLKVPLTEPLSKASSPKTVLPVRSFVPLPTVTELNEASEDIVKVASEVY
tara:strand:- start:191 stop:544 length:354 start_codon:yes stop_codon:yes gene_type:complete